MEGCGQRHGTESVEGEEEGKEDRRGGGGVDLCLTTTGVEKVQRDEQRRQHKERRKE